MRSYLTAYWYSQPPTPASAELVVKLTQDCEPSTSHIAPDAKGTHNDARYAAIDSILAQEDLYHVLGLQNSVKLDQLALRRAYLARSRLCHPECVMSQQISGGTADGYSAASSQTITNLPRLLSRK